MRTTRPTYMKAPLALAFTLVLAALAFSTLAAGASAAVTPAPHLVIHSFATPTSF